MHKELFLVIHEESSFGARAYVFEEEDWAMKMASRIVSTNVKNPDDIDDTLTPDMMAAGVIYHAIYNEEGDVVRVEKTFLLNKKTSSFEKEH